LPVAPVPSTVAGRTALSSNNRRRTTVEESLELDVDTDERCGYCGSEDELMGSLTSPNGYCCLNCVLASV
jgi:hypothetical protein